MQVGNWQEAKFNLILARTLGVDIIHLFRKKYESIANFEVINGIQLPADIAAMLTPP